MPAKQGLYANIHAKQERIAHGSGETMREPVSGGAPTEHAFEEAAKGDKGSNGAAKKPAAAQKPTSAKKSATASKSATSTKPAASKKAAAGKAEAGATKSRAR